MRTSRITQIVHHDEVVEIEVIEVARSIERNEIVVEYVDASGNHYWRSERVAASHR